MSSTEVTVREQKGELAVQGSMSLSDIVEQTRLIQEAMKAVMKDGEHYGVIPGTNKPSLYKAGAEKLLLLFRLAPEYQIIEKVEMIEPPLISYVIECRLLHAPTGTFTGSGVGSCNTREAKYRFKTVPTDKKPNKAEADRLKAAGKGKWRKFGNDWVWCELVENDNPHEYQNTVLKMAQKRALVAAVLNSTAASDCFTQDVEDLPEFAPRQPAPTAGTTEGNTVEGEGSTTPPAVGQQFEPPAPVEVPPHAATTGEQLFTPPAEAPDVGTGDTVPEPPAPEYEPVEGEVHPPAEDVGTHERYFNTREQAKGALLSGMIALAGVPGWSEPEILANAAAKWQRPISSLDDLSMDEMRAIYAGMKTHIERHRGGS